MSPPVQNGGVVILPGTLPPANATAPTQWIFVTEWVSDAAPKPVDLQIDTVAMYAVGVTPSGWPPLRPMFNAGGGDGVDPIQGTTAIVRLELGQGPNARVLYCDLKSGRFALGSQTRVRVSIARWQTADANNQDTRVEIGISETDGSGEYLTYSFGGLEVLAGNAAGLQFPPGAAWFDYYSEGDFESSYVIGDDFGYSARLAAQSPPVYIPPTSPLPVSRPSVVFTNVGADPASLIVVVWVR